MFETSEFDIFSVFTAGALRIYLHLRISELFLANLEFKAA